MKFPKVFPTRNDVLEIRETFKKGEWYFLPVAILAFVVSLWPISCGAFAYNLFKQLGRGGLK